MSHSGSNERDALRPP